MKSCQGCWSGNIKEQLGRCPTCFSICVLASLLSWGSYFYFSLEPVGTITAIVAGCVSTCLLVLHICVWLMRRF